MSKKEVRYWKSVNTTAFAGTNPAIGEQLKLDVHIGCVS